MLKYFEVENFKGFRQKLSLDFTARDYNFNPSIVKNGLVKNALIYGKNGSGKSSLGIALFDAVSHLTDTEEFGRRYTDAYKNLSSKKDEPVRFRYVFEFEDASDDQKGKHLVDYEYEKFALNELISEKLKIDGGKVVDWNFADPTRHFVDPQKIFTLEIRLEDNKLSVIKYLYRNLPTNTIPMLTNMVSFFEHMLWYRSLSDGNTFAGYTTKTESLAEGIHRENKLEDFQKFLEENGQKFELEFKSVNGSNMIYAKFNDGEKDNYADFNSIASTGTKALMLYYYWNIIAFDDLSFLFVDEFDAFFHYELAASIIRRINQRPNFQSVLTTHNTSLMNNELTRPDCCFILSNNRITSLSDATDKEIREAHNLEKMYQNGVFCE